MLIPFNNRSKKSKPVAQKPGPRRQQDVLSGVPGQLKQDTRVV